MELAARVGQQPQAVFTGIGVFPAKQPPARLRRGCGLEDDEQTADRWHRPRHGEQRFAVEAQHALGVAADHRGGLERSFLRLRWHGIAGCSGAVRPECDLPRFVGDDALIIGAERVVCRAVERTDFELRPSGERGLKRVGRLSEFAAGELARGDVLQRRRSIGMFLDPVEPSHPLVQQSRVKPLRLRD